MINDGYYSGKYAGSDSYDASWREPYFEALRIEAGADAEAEKIVDALKKMYSMYTDDLIKWYANLYDPGTGAYYCSTSGKENEGFWPDIESTRQALNFLENSGLLDHVGADFRNILTDEMKKKLIIFAKGMQRPNGYFYNYLKTEEEMDGPSGISKRGRELGWCTGILDYLGDAPTYDTPNGFRGNGLDKYGNPVEDFVPTSSDKGKSAPASSNYPEYLENKETMLAYLNEKIDIVNKTYPAGNQLNATCGQYKARDVALGTFGTEESMCKALIEWLNERINPDSGFWAPDISFNGANGFFKVIGLYNGWGFAYPAIERAIESILEVILSDTPSLNNICEVYNLWSGLISAKKNVILCYPEGEKEKILAKIEKTMKERGPEAILNTYKKQSGYQKADGAYAHAVTRGNDPTKIVHHHGGIPTGLCLEEGDVDAIGKATTGIIGNILSAYGFKSKLPIYCKRDWELYKSILDNAKPVVKNTKPLR